MSAYKHTLGIEVFLHTDCGRNFRVVYGEIFEEVRGGDFVVTSKVVIREDIVYVAHQLFLAREA